MTGAALRMGQRCLMVLVLEAGLLGLATVPAAADHVPTPAGTVAGSGNLMGTELVLEENFTPPACFFTTRVVYGLGGDGTYHGRTAGGQEVVYRAQLNEGEKLYQGPLRVEAEASQPFYHGPEGTHGSDSACSPATAGTPIPAQFRVFAADHVYRLDGTGAQVPCTGQGNYVRKSQRGNWHADWTLSQDCVVVGNQAGTPGEGVAPAGTAHTHVGSHAPCSNVCNGNIQVDYKQYLPVDGLAVVLGGPASALIGDPVTMIAGVTDDGLAAPGAAVTFSVAGPGSTAPPAGSAATGADGRATFTFTAAAEGDYTVTASATSALHPGQIVSATRTVRFNTRVPTISLTGTSKGQTDENVTLTAKVQRKGTTAGGVKFEPAPGVTVDFAVTGPGQATPAQGSGITDANGQARFAFAGNRAGHYTVTASATDLGQEVSASHTVGLAVKTLQLVGSIDLPADETLGVAVTEPTGNYAYFATESSAEIVKVDLDTFQRVGALSLISGESGFVSAFIDPAGTYAYFAASGGTVVKVDLNAFQRVGAFTIALDPGVREAVTSGVIDPTGAYAYFGTAFSSSPFAGRMIKVDLATSQQVGAITLDSGELVQAAAVDPAGQFAYFGTAGSGERVIKVDLATFARVGTIMLPDADTPARSIAIDPAGRFAYLGTRGSVLKVDLTTFERVGAIVPDVPGDDLNSAVMDPSGRFAYFGDFRNRRIVKADLERFEVVHVLTLEGAGPWSSPLVMQRDGTHLYVGTPPGAGTSVPGDEVPPKLLKVSLTRPPKVALAAGDDAFSTGYLTPLTVPAPGVLANDVDTEDGDPLIAGDATHPAGGSVTLEPNGSFTYTPDAGFSGVDSFTYTASDGMDFSAPATVSVAVAAPPDGVASVNGGAFGFSTTVSLFGGPAEPRGPHPSVTLAPDGGDQSVTDPDGAVGQYGPAYIFENHGPLTVHTEGTTGPGGSSTASAIVEDIEDNDPFHAHSPDGEATSTCSANEDGLSGSARVVNGRLVVHTDPVEGTPTEQVTFPHVWEPAPNTVYEGALDHIGDRWRIVFNEQILGPDSITVNAVHMYLLGPTAVGDMVIGQSRCGVELATPNPAPGAVDDAYTATTGLALTLPASGVLANDTAPDGQPLSATTLAPTPPPASGGGAWTFPSDPAHGTLDLNHDGSFTYTPDAGFTGTDTFPYLVQDSRGGTDQATVNITVEPAPEGQPPVADFDGDGDTDVSVFRPSTGVWFVQKGATTAWGTHGDIAVPADYDGDATTDVAVFRPSNGLWFVKASTAGESATAWGAGGDLPVPADYDGDGKADVAVFRPSAGVWFVKGSTGAESASAWGADGDVPVPADYDGDSRADIAVFRPSSGVWFVQPSDGAAPSATFFGTAGDVPTPGDYDGDGRSDIAVFRPSNGIWFVKSTTAGESAMAWGTDRDVPAPGDYDGDGTTDMAVFRPSAGVWFVQPGTATVWGADGDVPLPQPPGVRQAVV